MESSFWGAIIQVQGLVNEELSSLTFDVSNALEVLTNQTGYTSELFYDTNLLAFTTNSFQLYDVPLTNGLNSISIPARSCLKARGWRRRKSQDRNGSNEP
ncbi:MAG TPA: hypothetical protein VE344_02895 [Methylomirabilota bacterium]|nr:hypothetical protein [Methylomirabilota bacterium]